MPSPAGCHRPACSPNGYEESNGGVPAVHPVDAWCQLAVHASVTELVLVGDALVRRRKPIAQRDDLRDAVKRWAGRRGAGRLREAEALVRDRTDSPRETRLRLRRSIMASRNPS